MKMPAPKRFGDDVPELFANAALALGGLAGG